MDTKNLPKNIGVIGVGAMGVNIINNIAQKHKELFVYNRSENNFEKIPPAVFKTTDLKKFLNEMKAGVILLFIPANSIKSVMQKIYLSINELNLQNKFFIADGGNSYFVKSMELKPMFSDSFNYVCIGTSGGAKGALNGPAMMLGCNIEYKDYLLEVLSIVTPYATFVGEYFMADFVKMVHNGIEYGIMGALGEYTNLLVNVYGSVDKVIEFYTFFNGMVDTYLVECMIKALKKKESGRNVILEISNKIDQKGTGKWCVIESMKSNISTRLIANSVYDRISSEDTGTMMIDPIEFNVNQEKVILSLLFIIYCSYYEGLKLLEGQYKQDNQLFEIKIFKKCWKKNCIIESKILNTLGESSDLTDFLTFFHTNYKNLLNIEVSKEVLITDVFNAFREMSLSFFGKPSSIFCAAMQYLTLNQKSCVVGRSIQAIRDMFGQHGININGETKNIDWDS